MNDQSTIIKVGGVCLWAQQTVSLVAHTSRKPLHFNVADTAKILSLPKTMVFKKESSLVLVWDLSRSLCLRRMHYHSGTVES